jgi:hypothetical protein
MEKKFEKAMRRFRKKTLRNSDRIYEGNGCHVAEVNGNLKNKADQCRVERWIRDLPDKAEACIREARFREVRTKDPCGVGG